MESRNWKRKHDWCVHTLENILITAMNEFKRHNIYVRKANKNSSLFPPEVWRRHSQSRLLCCYLINSTRRPLLFFALFFFNHKGVSQWPDKRLCSRHQLTENIETKRAKLVLIFCLFVLDRYFFSQETNSSVHIYNRNQERKTMKFEYSPSLRSWMAQSETFDVYYLNFFKYNFFFTFCRRWSERIAGLTQSEKLYTHKKRTEKKRQKDIIRQDLTRRDDKYLVRK